MGEPVTTGAGGTAVATHPSRSNTEPIADLLTRLRIYEPNTTQIAAVIQWAAERNIDLH
jgi:hypothetical protein